MNVIAVIPARGGSKGIPRKNLKPLQSKPLLAHSIEQARQANCVSDVFVSTDDSEIANVARKYGAGVIQRPAELSGDTAASEEALLHALDHLQAAGRAEPDLVVFLQCTSPIRTSNDIEAAVEQLRHEEADSLLSVVPGHRFLWREAVGAPISVNYDYRARPRRQDRAPEFVENGCIYVFKPWVLRQLRNRLGGKVALYIMGYWSQFDIDTFDDLRLCEWILSQESGRD